MRLAAGTSPPAFVDHEGVTVLSGAAAGWHVARCLRRRAHRDAPPFARAPSSFAWSVCKEIADVVAVIGIPNPSE